MTIRKVLEDNKIFTFKLDVEEALKFIRQILEECVPKKKEFDEQLGYDALTNVRYISIHNQVISEIQERIKKVCK